MNGTAVRRWHMYIGLVTAPSLIFFCLTGALQLFSLHEAHGSYHPFALVEKLSSVHKDQVLEQHHDHGHVQSPQKAEEAASEEPGHQDHEDHAESWSAGTMALKTFFLLVALALTTSASLGVWIGVTQSRQRRLCWILLSVGVVLPSVFLALA